MSVVGCQSSIKNENSNIIVEEGVDTSIITQTDSIKLVDSEVILETPIEFKEYLGYWVGYFIPNLTEDNLWSKQVKEGVYWTRENKITISIDYINDSIVKGHKFAS